MKSHYILVIALAFTCICSSGQAADEGCRRAYANAYWEIDQTAEFSETMTGAGTAVGGMLAIGGGAGGGPAMLTTGAGAVTFAGLTTVSQIRKESLMKVIRLIDQSEVGIGLDLSEFSKEMKISNEVAAATIRDFNSRYILCDSSTGLISLSEIKDLVKVSLRKK